MFKEVNRFLIQSTRESLGLSRQALAHSVCVSEKQIEQLEEGGYRYFYSPQHKYYVAKKVAHQLGLHEESIFIDGYDYSATSAVGLGSSQIHSTTSLNDL